MRRFYKHTLCMLHKFRAANHHLHHGLLGMLCDLRIIAHTAMIRYHLLRSIRGQATAQHVASGWVDLTTLRIDDSAQT